MVRIYLKHIYDLSNEEWEGDFDCSIFVFIPPESVHQQRVQAGFQQCQRDDKLYEQVYSFGSTYSTPSLLNTVFPNFYNWDAQRRLLLAYNMSEDKIPVDAV